MAVERGPVDPGGLGQRADRHRARIGVRNRDVEGPDELAPRPQRPRVAAVDLGPTAPTTILTWVFIDHHGTTLPLKDTCRLVVQRHVSSSGPPRPAAPPLRPMTQDAFLAARR